MAKAKKFKGRNAELVGDTRLTRREMKKMQAAYHNVARDMADRVVKNVKAIDGMDIDKPANLGELQ